MSSHAASQFLGETALSPFASVLQKWLTADLEQILTRLDGARENFFPAFLQSLNIEYECAPTDIGRIPTKGPAIVVANHPFGLADGAILGALLSGIRTDFRFLANSLLAPVPQLGDYILPVDPFGGQGAANANYAGLRKSIKWIKAGGLLAVFPAGEVASMRVQSPGIHEPQWTENVARLIQHTSAPVVPVFFHGTNSPAFHLAGLIHHQLRTVLLPHELLNKAGTKIRVSIGTPIRPDRVVRSAEYREATEYLRARTFMMKSRGKAMSNVLHFPHPFAKNAPVAEETDSSGIAREFSELPQAQLLVCHKDYRVYVASAKQIPQALSEIGRLREITFRQVGEGTGAARDLDAFDSYYQHLVLWNQTKQDIVGAYRMGKADEILKSIGLNGLYTSMLFRLRPDFHQRIAPALELGRSFVRPEYQRGYLPLLLLWQGLGHYVAANPQYRVLFGPVSISKEYALSSRMLMVSYLKARHRNQALAKYVHPRKQFRMRRPHDISLRNFSGLLENLDDLSEVVADLESDHKGIPVLLQHYLGLGGEILDFSVDKSFSNVLDGLIVVDLVKTNRRQLERYMGKVNAENFLRHHDAAVPA